MVIPMLGALFPHVRCAFPYLACRFGRSYAQTTRRHSIFFTIIGDQMWGLDRIMFGV
jgi:hypothetical protein